MNKHEVCNYGSENPQEDIKNIHIDFGGRILVIGLGSIGLGIIPLLVRHVNFCKTNPIRVITGDDRLEAAKLIRKEYGIESLIQYLTKDNYEAILDQFHLESGDFIVNVSVDVSSHDIILWCNKKGVLYIDTVVCFSVLCCN